MAAHQPFPRGTFKVEPGPGKNEVSVIFKPTQSTIVFSVSRPGELAPEYRVHHTRAGRFGPLWVKRLRKPPESWHWRLPKKPGRDRDNRKGAHGSALDPLHLLEAGAHREDCRRQGVALGGRRRPSYLAP